MARRTRRQDNGDSTDSIAAHGLRLHALGHVRILRETDAMVFAHVQDSQEYEVELSRLEDPRARQEASNCTCRAFAHTGTCKHLYAVHFEFARGEDRTHGDGGDDGRWKQRLEAIEVAPTRPAGAPSSEDDERVRYLLDVDASRNKERIVLRLTIQSRREGNTWTAPRPLGLGSVHAREVTNPRQQRLLQLLRGAEQEQSHHTHWTHHATSVVLPSESADLLLPEICATGELTWSHRGVEGGPLAWETKGPWTLHYGTEEQDGIHAVSCELRHRRSSIELEGILLFLESGLVVTEDRVIPFEQRGNEALARDLWISGPLRIPSSEARIAFLSLAMKLGEPIHGSGVELPSKSTPPEVCLHIEAPEAADGPLQTLACVHEFLYGGVVVEPDEPSSFVLLPEGQGILRRDFKAESAAESAFLELGGRQSDKDRRRGVLGSVRPKELPRLVSGLLELGWDVRADGHAWKRPGKARARVRTGIDWFELEGDIDYGEERVPFPAILAAVQKGQTTVALGDGSHGIIPEEWMRRWGLLELGDSKKGGPIRFAENQGWMLDALLAENDQDVDAGFERYRKRLAKFDGVRPRKEPRGFQGELRDYQRVGLGWFEFLAGLGLGGCLADDMGLGKTIQVLALLEKHRAAGQRPDGVHRTSLVVAPKSVIFNWIDEAQRFAPKLRVLDYTGIKRRARAKEAGEVDLWLTTYGTLRRDVSELRNRDFHYVILDESQAIKNASSQSAKSARLLRGQHRLALSGTPIENNLGELWSLLEFLNPGMLGRSSAFQRFMRDDLDDHEIRGELAQALRPFLLRRTKEEVLEDLPPKTEQILSCALSKEQRKEYEELRDHYRSILMAKEAEVGLNRMKMNVLEALLRLRQAACHPGLIDKERQAEDSAKLDVLIPKLEEIVGRGHKAIVFSQFTTFLGIVKARLDALEIPYEVLDGRTRKRKERVDRFNQDPGCPIFLVSLKAGGSGLNLTAADYVFLLDPWWNPAVERQAVDRAHRIGRTRPVHAYRVVCEDTVEQRVLELQDRKRELAEAVLGEGSASLGSLQREDLELLLR